MELNAGPLDDSVLYKQAAHISNDISADNIDKTLRVRRCDNLIWKLYEGGNIHHRVLSRIYDMGFYGIIRCGFFKYDSHLISAVVERWRRETHTFHFPVGEATITLQDVELVWGLNIDGRPITGIDLSYKPHEWQPYCYELLGFIPQVNQFRGSKLLMSALYDYCTTSLIQDDSSDIDVVRYCRCVALMIIGGCMFPDSDGCSVSLIYLNLLQDMDQVSGYSWGSAVLAFLYRELCNASTIGKDEIAGPLFILQVWALSRLKFLCPDPLGYIPDDDDHEDQFIPFPPFGERWNRFFIWTHTSTHSIRIIRDLLDKMEPNQFKWLLYGNEFGKKDVWRSVCPLICFNIVEMHRPNRVLRQFGMLQNIPLSALDGDALHKCSRRGRPNFDWAEFHKNIIDMWDNRLNLIVQNDPIGRNTRMTREYKMWYDRITRRFITPVNLQVEYGYQPGHAHFRRAVMNDAEVLRSWFRGLSLQDQPREELEAAIAETIAIGNRLYGLAESAEDDNSFHEQVQSPPPQPQPQPPQQPQPQPPQQPQPHAQPRPQWQPRRVQYEESSSSSFSHSDHHTRQSPFHEEHVPCYVPMQPVEENENLIFQTPDRPYAQSVTELLSAEVGHFDGFFNQYHNISPVPFAGYSDPQFVENDARPVEQENDEYQAQSKDKRKGKRQIRKPRCGTGGHRG